MLDVASSDEDRRSMRNVTLLLFWLLTVGLASREARAGEKPEDNLERSRDSNFCPPNPNQQIIDGSPAVAVTQDVTGVEKLMVAFEKKVGNAFYLALNTSTRNPSTGQALSTHEILLVKNGRNPAVANFRDGFLLAYWKITSGPDCITEDSRSRLYVREVEINPTTGSAIVHPEVLVAASETDFLKDLYVSVDAISYGTPPNHEAVLAYEFRSKRHPLNSSSNCRRLLRGAWIEVNPEPGPGSADIEIVQDFFFVYPEQPTGQYFDGITGPECILSYEDFDRLGTEPDIRMFAVKRSDGQILKEDIGAVVVSAWSVSNSPNPPHELNDYIYGPALMFRQGFAACPGGPSTFNYYHYNNQSYATLGLASSVDIGRTIITRVSSNLSNRASANAELSIDVFSETIAAPNGGYSDTNMQGIRVKFKCDGNSLLNVHSTGPSARWFDTEDLGHFDSYPFGAERRHFPTTPTSRNSFGAPGSISAPWQDLLVVELPDQSTDRSRAGAARQSGAPSSPLNAAPIPSLTVGPSDHRLPRAAIGSQLMYLAFSADDDSCTSPQGIRIEFSAIP